MIGSGQRKPLESIPNQVSTGPCTGFYLVYHDPVDAGFGKQVMTMLGYDAEDVKNKFYDDDFNNGWEVIKIYRHRV